MKFKIKITRKDGVEDEFEASKFWHGSNKFFYQKTTKYVYSSELSTIDKMEITPL